MRIQLSLLLGLTLFTAAGCHYPEVIAPAPLTEVEILRMSKEGVPPDEIISRIRSSRTVYILDAKDVVRLHESGVDDKVIDYMLATQRWDIENRAHYHHHSHCDCWHGYPHVHAGFGWHVW